MRILIVEDEPISVIALEADLEDAGHRVIGCATTAREAVDMAEALGPDLMLVDARLRDGSSGIAAAAEVFDRFGIPAIACTGDASLVAQAEPAIRSVLEKPYTVEALMAAIDAIDRPSASPALA